MNTVTESGFLNELIALMGSLGNSSSPSSSELLSNENSSSSLPAASFTSFTFARTFFFFELFSYESFMNDCLNLEGGPSSFFESSFETLKLPLA